jgi:hypothetical protein
VITQIHRREDGGNHFLSNVKNEERNDIFLTIQLLSCDEKQYYDPVKQHIFI